MTAETQSDSFVGASRPAGKAGRNYIARHWRGELSLPVSFWVNGWLLDIPLGLLIVGIALAQRVSGLAKPALAAEIAVWIPSIIISVWQLVGAWRSAGHHVERGGRRLWAVLARIGVGLGYVGLIFQTVIRVPEIVELTRILAGDQALGPRQLRLASDTELAFAGGITFGATEDVRRMLDANPLVTVIHLNSRGGRIVEAQHLRALIQERGLTTYVSDFCMSACASAFIGGRERFIAPDARIGFHQPSLPGSAQIIAAVAIGEEKQALVRAGVSPDFAERAFGTPAASMWYPTLQELQSANVITGVAAPGQFGRSAGTFPVNADELDGEFAKVPIFAAIQKYEPATYRQFRDSLASSVSAGDTRMEMIVKARPIIMALAKKYLPIASGDAMMEMASISADEMDQIGAKDPVACYRLITSAPIDIQRYVSPDLVGRELAALTRVIESGAAAPQPIPSEASVMPALEELRARIADKYGEDAAALDALSAPADAPPPDHVKVCRMTAAFYREVIAFDAERRDMLLRFMFSS